MALARTDTSQQENDNYGEHVVSCQRQRHYFLPVTAKIPRLHPLVWRFIKVIALAVRDAGCWGIILYLIGVQ